MSKKTSLAKINRPRLFGVVPRERLFASLDENRGRPLIWISGPPGAGKTTLVASYLEDRGLPIVWYQIDSGDADPATLFHYLALAAETLGTAVSTPLPRLVPEHLSDLASFARLFFRAFFAQLPEGLVLVLDNYQEAPLDASLHEIVRQAIAEVPPGHSVIGISRIEAPLGFVQLAASGAMTSVGWDKLQLSLDEVRAIAAKRRLGHFDGEAQELPTETRESVFNYFASLIFDQASEETRHILLSIAFLPRVTPSLAVELSGRTDAPALLEDLYRRRMFTDRTSGAEQVYQFHALFLDFLRDRVRVVLAPEGLDELVGRSAAVLEGSGEFDAAMDLRIAAGDWDEAVRMILQEANGLLNNGRRQTLERWIRAIPSTKSHAYPWIVYWLGMAQVQTEPAHGIETLQEALGGFRVLGDVQGQILCLAALLNAANLGYSAVEAMDGWLDELLAKMDQLQAFPSPDVELRVWGVLCSALFWSRPWHPWTASAAHRVEALLARGGAPAVALAAAASALSTTSTSGEFECGDRITEATAHLVDGRGASPSEAAWWLARAGYLRFVEARYEEALGFIRRACEVAESNGMRATFAITIYTRFMVEFRVSGWTVANATLAEMEAMPRPNYPVGEAMLYVYQARRAQFRGRCDEAADLAELTHAAILRTGSQYQEMRMAGACRGHARPRIDATQGIAVAGEGRQPKVLPALSRMRHASNVYPGPRGSHRSGSGAGGHSHVSPQTT